MSCDMCMYAYLYPDMCMYSCVCVYVCMYVSMYVCMHACMHVRTDLLENSAPVHHREASTVVIPCCLKKQG